MENLPDDIQWYIWKIYFSKNVVVHFGYKDWWWHSVKVRGDVNILFYLDPEKSTYPTKGDYFSVNY